MYNVGFNGNEYEIDFPKSQDEECMSGLYDLATMLKSYIATGDGRLNETDLILEIRDFLEQFMHTSMAMGINELGKITPYKADAWITMYNKCSVIFISGVATVTSTGMEQQAKELTSILQQTGYNVECKYSKVNPHFDFEVWSKDNMFGIGLFITKDFKLCKDFYGFMSGDDHTYEDMTVNHLENFL